jgi:hypothetical protein
MNEQALRPHETLLKGWKCLRCGWEWVPRSKEEPELCAKCRTPYWNKPRRVKP